MKRNKLDQIKITKWAKIWTNITLRAQYQPVLRGSLICGIPLNVYTST
jgi:hypothetical protein